MCAGTGWRRSATRWPVVLQKNVLFTGSIYENVRWGDEHATDEEVQRVCRLAQADTFIREFPAGYDTMIVEGGNNVSGGQKQRLCIARALLKKPKILILDDSTSAVDTRTDALIRQAFREEIPDNHEDHHCPEDFLCGGCGCDHRHGQRRDQTASAHPKSF